MREPEELDELATLLALDALPADEQADAELTHGTFPAAALSVAALLAEDTVRATPEQLRASTLDAALARRAPGRSDTAHQPVSAAEAFAQTAAELRDLLASLTPAEWDAHAHEEHGSVHDLVAHLTGVERLSAAWLDPSAPPPVDPSVPHVEATRPYVMELAGTAPDELVDTWFAAARAVLAAAADGPADRPVTFHDITSSVDGLLVMRTFELWAHGMDIALATGRPAPLLDDARMALLSRRLMAALPRALAYRRTTAPDRTARFVLTGPAGGVYTVPLHPRTEPDEPDVTIVADAVALCRVAARRLRPADLGAVVEGDAALAELVLAGVDAFARD